jgi:hypothetical protein
VQPGDAVGRVVHGEATVLEELDDRAGDVAVILDQQHGGLSRVIGHGSLHWSRESSAATARFPP